MCERKAMLPILQYLDLWDFFVCLCSWTLERHPWLKCFCSRNISNIPPPTIETQCNVADAAHLEKKSYSPSRKSLKFQTTKPLDADEEEASLSQKPSSLQTTTESISLLNIDHFENEEIVLLHNELELNDIGSVKTTCLSED